MSTGGQLGSGARDIGEARARRAILRLAHFVPNWSKNYNFQEISLQKAMMSRFLYPICRNIGTNFQFFILFCGKYYKSGEWEANVACLCLDLRYLWRAWGSASLCPKKLGLVGLWNSELLGHTIQGPSPLGSAGYAHRFTTPFRLISLYGKWLFLEIAQF